MHLSLESGMSRKNEFQLKPPMIAFSSGSRATITKIRFNIRLNRYNLIKVALENPLVAEAPLLCEFRSGPSIKTNANHLDWDNYCIDS